MESGRRKLDETETDYQNFEVKRRGMCYKSQNKKKIDPKSLGQVKKELTGRQGGNSRVWI